MTKQEKEWQMIFAASCIEAAARRLNIDTQQMYRRMKAVNMIDDFILKHYKTLHTMSREYVTDDIIECLNNWEQAKKTQS